MCFFQNSHIPRHLKKEYKEAQKTLGAMSKEERHRIMKDVNISMGWDHDEAHLQEVDRAMGLEEED